MKKLILLLTLVAVSFSAEQWEYAIGEYIGQYMREYPDKTRWELTYNENETEKDIIYARNLKVYDGDIKNFRLYGMNKMGQDGWELVMCYIDDQRGSRSIYHFKRKIEDK